VAYGWKGTVGQFLADRQVATRGLADNYVAYYAGQPGVSQRTAWDHELAILDDTFRALPRATDWGLVMEYELPFEGGRRVDKVALAAENVVAMEFKDAAQVKRADLDQVRAYARDLVEYHTACRDRRVEPVLVLANYRGGRLDADGTPVVGPDDLPFVLSELAGAGQAIDIDRFVNGTYAPLPTLVEAARRVFRDEPLPAIRRAESSRIPDLIQWLKDLVRRAQERKERHLVLITGVPGAGKTLVGLQFVHEFGEPGEAPAVFLSGNGPLVQLLQYVLRSKVFVRPMRNFILEYGVRRRSLPNQHVLVFDEAQRAWDVDHVRSKHEVEFSEPQMLLDIASRLSDWAVVIGLVGEGQEIHIGEEAGMGQWLTALQGAAVPFTVHVPSHLASIFQSKRPSVDDLLNLTLSLRTQRAAESQDWVRAVIDGAVEQAARLAPDLKNKYFDVYVTPDLFEAKSYLYSRYADAPEKRFGLLASSKARNLQAVGIDNTYYGTQRLKIGPWYTAASADAESCCQLRQPATEFQSQGLELDMPVVCWGDDLAWEGTWVAKRKTLRARDSAQLRRNAYRVLLSRGRDGVIVYVPPNLPNSQQRAVEDVFLQAGAKRLEEARNG